MQEALNKLSKLMDAYVITNTAESQGHEEVQEALRTQQQYCDGTLFTEAEEDLVATFSPGRKTLILGEQSSPEMISDSDAEDTILTQKACVLFVFVILRCSFSGCQHVSTTFNILKRFMVWLFKHPRTKDVRRTRHLNPMRQNLVIAKNLLWKLLKSLNRSQGKLERMMQLTRRGKCENICGIGHANTHLKLLCGKTYCFYLDATFSWPAMSQFSCFQEWKLINKWMWGDIHAGDPMYVQSHNLK